MDQVNQKNSRIERLWRSKLAERARTMNDKLHESDRLEKAYKALKRKVRENG